jgi:hypothetical protein
MGVFLRRYGAGPSVSPSWGDTPQGDAREQMQTHLEGMERVVATLCDEEQIDNTAR